MKKILPFLLSVFYCTTVLAQKYCPQYDYQVQLLKHYPGIQNEYEKIEAFQRRYTRILEKAGKADTAAAAIIPMPVPEQIVIPVVVHIVWNTGEQNISDARVLSQLDVLNKDFNALNTDRNKIPSYFISLAASCGITFKLATSDPQGKPTSGIVRRQTATGIFGYDDKVKSTLWGGDDAWDANSYLNIWVCNLTGGISGYASAPGTPASKDGVVISTTAFGMSGSGGAFNLGRTAVHETGHWLNLRHIWGDANCGDDKVDDTPVQQGPNRGCNSGEKFSCGNTAHGDMYMNFMDFSDDACMYMFTKGQRQRMRVLFEAGGPRRSLLYSNGLKGEGLPLSLPPADESGFHVSLYPNPAVNSITVQCDGNSCLGKKLTISNHLGQIVKAAIVTSKMQQIDISALHAGMYFIKVDGMETKKFVKN